MIKNKGDARRETLAKANAFGDARIRYAIYYIHCRMGIPPSKLRAITKAWWATNVDSKILWTKADRETIDMLRTVKRERAKLPLTLKLRNSHQEVT